MVAPIPATTSPAPAVINAILIVMRDPIRANFFDMAAQRDQLRRDRETIEGLLAASATTGELATDALSSIESVRGAPELSNALKELSDKQASLRTYRYHYSDAYPPLQRLTREVAQLQHQTIPALARDLAAQLGSRESEIGRQVDAASTDLRQIPARTIEEVRLRRNVDAVGPSSWSSVAAGKAPPRRKSLRVRIWRKPSPSASRATRLVG